MVRRCASAGVDVYVDAVINHMAALNRDFPLVPYTSNDFHTCRSTINYSNRFEVQNCDLVGLNDLKTESEYVRRKIADYMNDLIDLGVKGFRLDAAKHMASGDIRAIVSKLKRRVFIFQEVIGAGGEAVQPSEYVSNGAVTEFKFERTVGHFFKGRAKLKDIRHVINSRGWMRSDDAVVFVSNHDDQRQNTQATLTYKDIGNLYYIGEIFSLAYPYGYPKVMSSYFFEDHDQGPPRHGVHSGGACGREWVCEHRWRGISNMVEFRGKTSGKFFVSHWWDNGNHQIGFGRGGLGYVMINREDFATIDKVVDTGMRQGTYCDIVNGEVKDGLCDGATISVGADGKAHFKVGAIGAAAIHVGSLVRGGGGGNGGGDGSQSDDVEVSFECRNGQTVTGQGVYVVGSSVEVGVWEVGRAVQLSAAAYPTWRGTISMTRGQRVEWKCIKRSEAKADNEQMEQWQGGANNVLVASDDGQLAVASF